MVPQLRQSGPGLIRRSSCFLCLGRHELSSCLRSRADYQRLFACSVPMYVYPTTYSFDHNLVNHEPFVHLQEETHIIVVKQVERLNKKEDLARVKGGLLQWVYRPFVIPVNPVFDFLQYPPLFSLACVTLKHLLKPNFVPIPKIL